MSTPSLRNHSNCSGPEGNAQAETFGRSTHVKKYGRDITGSLAHGGRIGHGYSYGSVTDRRRAGRPILAALLRARCPVSVL